MLAAQWHCGVNNRGCVCGKPCQSNASLAGTANCVVHVTPDLTWQNSPATTPGAVRQSYTPLAGLAGLGALVQAA